MKINPMLKKEIMVSVRGIRLTVMMLIFNIVLALIGLVVFASILDNARWSGSIDYSATITFYVVLVVIQFLLLAFLVPSLTAGAISGERERQTLDILLASDLTPGKIVFGKLFSSLLSVVLLLLSSLPVMSLVFIFGGVGIGDLIVNVVFLMYVALFAGSIGIACSAKFRKTTAATAASYGFVMLFGLGTVLIAGLLAIIFNMIDFQDWMAWPMAIVLLLNPGMTLVDIIGGQVGGSGFLSQMFYGSNLAGLNFVIEHWSAFSFVLQGCIVVFMLRSAVKRVNPLSKRKPGKRSRKEQRRNGS